MLASRKSLLVVRAGEDSLHSSWIRGRRDRNFDLLVSYYGAVPGKYERDGEHYHVMVGSRCGRTFSRRSTLTAFELFRAFGRQLRPVAFATRIKKSGSLSREKQKSAGLSLSVTGHSFAAA